MPPVTNTWTGITHAFADCHDCGATWGSRNAVGLANQHARRTGHEVAAEQMISITYNRREP